MAAAHPPEPEPTAAPEREPQPAEPASAAEPAMPPHGPPNRPGLDPAGWRPTIVLAAAISILVLGSQFLNGAIPVRGGIDDPLAPPGSPIEITDRVTIEPAPGWTLSERFVEIDGIRLSRGEVAIDVWVTTFPDSPEALVEAWADEILEPESSTLSTSAPEAITIADAYPGATVSYIGIFTGVATPIEGILVGIVFVDDLAIVVDAWGPEGGLSPAIDDVRLTLHSLDVAE